MNRSNDSTTETTSVTMMMTMSPLGLSVSIASHLDNSPDVMKAKKKVLARAAGVMDIYVQIVSLVPGNGCFLWAFGNSETTIAGGSDDQLHHRIFPTFGD